LSPPAIAPTDPDDPNAPPGFPSHSKTNFQEISEGLSPPSNSAQSTPHVVTRQSDVPSTAPAEIPQSTLPFHRFETHKSDPETNTPVSISQMSSASHGKLSRSPVKANKLDNMPSSTSQTTSDPNFLEQFNDLHEHIIDVHKDVIRAIEMFDNKLSKLESDILNIENLRHENEKKYDYWFPKLNLYLRECVVLPKLNERQVKMSDHIETLVNNIRTASEEVQACREAILQRLERVLISTDRALGDNSGKDINFVKWIFDCIFGEFRFFFKRRSPNQKGFSLRNFSKYTVAYVVAWIGFGVMIGGLIWGMNDKSHWLGQMILTVLGWLISGVFFSLTYARKDDRWEITGPKIWSYHVALATFVVAFIFAL
jgi:hypothetical protein